VSVVRVVLVTCLLLIAASLFGSSAGAIPSSTQLRILALNSFVGRAAFHLGCAPPRGDVGDAAKACAALAAEPGLVTRPKPFVCHGGLTSWWDITITGRLDGRPIHTQIATCWTPQMKLIGRLGIGQSLPTHLLPRRREAVMPGIARSFAAGVLRPTDLVTCDILGHKLRQGVPIEIGTATTGYGGKKVTSVVLSVTHNRDGSVRASCHKGNA
jgi:hypothetical protein